MSHEDAVIKIPKDFYIIASTKESKLTVIESKKHKIYGVQFHPEVTHTDNGKIIFKNFLFNICKIKKSWNIGFQKKRLIQDIKINNFLSNTKNLKINNKIVAGNEAIKLKNGKNPYAPLAVELYPSEIKMIAVKTVKMK